MPKIKLLVVEDEENIHELYKASLGPDMFETRYVFNGKEALDIYQAWRPDMIVLDIWMPIMTGYLVLQEIRNTMKDKTTTIIMSTSATNSQDISDCLQFGIQGYIMKPFNLKEIGNKIVQYYQQHKSPTIQ
jgi:DNA-binding response OmpR family regulator